tara:strand:- start:48861 stop:49364 length:504 start_codon:yes stop_codon:yes gene_type:complete
MNLKILCIFLIAFTTKVNAQGSLDVLLDTYNTRSVPYISVEGLRMLQVNDSVVVLDARERNEYEVSHIASAKYIGFSEFSSEEITSMIKDKNVPIIVYCSLGIRSEEIGEKLQKEGYTNVKNLYGGIFEWKNNDYPVLDPKGNETEKVHAFSRSWGKWLTKGKKVYD